jgi:hypothetical protein
MLELKSAVFGDVDELNRTRRRGRRRWNRGGAQRLPLGLRWGRRIATGTAGQHRDSADEREIGCASLSPRSFTGHYDLPIKQLCVQAVVVRASPPAVPSELV